MIDPGLRSGRYAPLGDGLLDGGEEVRIGTRGRCQGAFHVDPEARCEFFG